MEGKNKQKGTMGIEHARMFEIGFACISHTYRSPYRISSPRVNDNHETPTAAPDERVLDLLHR
jgi:hypothetical protein